MSNVNKIKVTTTSDLANALAAGHDASNIEIVPPDTASAIAAARAEGVAEGKASATPDADAIRTTAVAAERVRIAAVSKLSRPGFEAIVSKGIDDGTPVADVALAIMTAAADRGVTLEAIRRDAPNPAPHANPTNDPKVDAGKSWDKHVATAPQRM